MTRLTVLRAHRPTARRTMRLLQLHALTGIHLTLVCHRPHLPTALHQALRTADYSVTTDFEAARRHYYGTPITEPPPADKPAGPADRWLTLPALDRLVSYDSPRPCADPCTPPPIAWRHRPPPVPLTAPTAQRIAHRLHAATHIPAWPRPLPPRCSPAPHSSNSPPPDPATTTTPRPRSPCTTAPATPTAAPPTPYHPGRHLPAGRGLLHPARVRRRPRTARRAGGPCAPAARGGDGQAAPAPANRRPP